MVLTGIDLHTLEQLNADELVTMQTLVEATRKDRQ